MTEFLSIIVIVFGILQIILFFKIWNMTNDVRRLHNRFVGYSRIDAKRYFLAGDKEKAKEVLLNIFFDNIQERGYLNFDFYKKQLEEDLAKTGEELPEEIKKLNSMQEFQDALSNKKVIPD